MHFHLAWGQNHSHLRTLRDSQVSEPEQVFSKCSLNCMNELWGALKPFFYLGQYFSLASINQWLFILYLCLWKERTNE